MDDGTILKILFAEDMIADFELAENELKKSSIQFKSLRVENSGDFEKSLTDFNPDIVISDYSMPQFNGMLALKIAKEHDPLLPLIILTGTLNEEIAVSCMKAGANDYVIKEHIGKLPFAVNESLRYRDAMREKGSAEKALLESESRYRSMFENNYAVMLLIDPEDGSISDVNPAASEFYGYSRNDLKCKNLSDINIEPDCAASNTPGMALPSIKKHFIARHKCKNGVQHDVEIFSSPVNYPGKKLSLFIIQDITERNRALEDLRTSLDEKKELIREIYHRTKNNMQVIISMFTLQSISADDERLTCIFRDMENRIRAMALVHEKLYQSKNLSKLDLKDYLTDLIYNIFSVYGATEDRIEINNEMKSFPILIDTAIPCGLVVNELVSNVVKHAFPGNRSGQLFLSLSINNNDEITLIVADNGIGKCGSLEPEFSQSMGLQIVKNIVEYQMKGSVKLDRSSGTKWQIVFRDNIYRERI